MVARDRAAAEGAGVTFAAGEGAAQALAVFTEANEDPEAFRTTSRYWVVEIAVG